MATAVCLIRTLPHYRHEAFTAGLARLGYRVVSQPMLPKHIGPDDVLVIWNRNPVADITAKYHEKAGSKVVVVENGYLDAVDEQGHQWFTLSLWHHNGLGAWFQSSGSRWDEMRLELSPWRTEGGRVVILPQRGVGPAGVAMPKFWPSAAMSEVMRRTKRPVHVRPHPGIKSKVIRPLYADLEGCHAVVTWGSSAALKAIQAGVPAFHALPGWVGADAALLLAGSDLEAPKMCDFARLTMFERLAWSQWRVREIENGDALAWLLHQKRLAT
jgi:hypothetical protein